MTSTLITTLGLALTLTAAESLAQGQSAAGERNRSTPSAPKEGQPLQAEAVREHLDAAQDRVDSLLEWQHVVTWRGNGDTPPPQGPADTLISIDKAETQRVLQLLDALASQVPAKAAGEPQGTAQGQSSKARGDIRAHVEKAQQIARTELRAPHATPTANESLVTIDRTSLLRLDVELDAIESLLARAAQ